MGTATPTTMRAVNRIADGRAIVARARRVERRRATRSTRAEKESGFTSLAETINGRCAMVGFVLAVMNTFNGDLLTMMAKVPLAVVFVIATISAASVVQKVNPTGYIPDNVNGAAMNAYSGAKLDEVFTYKAELVNGRMAMLAMLFFVATASIF